MPHPVTVLRPVGAQSPPGSPPGQLYQQPDFARTRSALGGATVWHVNTTATGGGIAELLRASIEWHERTGLRTRWMVISGSPEYFALTKRLHEMLHGRDSLGQPLTPADQACYQETTAAAAHAALDVIRPGDVAVLHDPQPLGMAAALDRAGVRVIWRSHIGTRQNGRQVDDAWTFLRPFLPGCRRFVFSAQDYIPVFLPPGQTAVIHPSIDPDSVKCADLDDEAVARLVTQIGLQSPAALGDHGPARVIQDRPLAPEDEVILQVARWDRLKDVPGVLTAYARHIAPHCRADLVLAGPDPQDIPDDPVGLSVFNDVVALRAELAPEVRARIHLVVLSLRDQDTNARIVNALQRRATVIVQKSLEEGFGLAVTEAMWKRRAVVASAVGGLTEQITDGVHGLLVKDPSDLAAFGAAVTTLLADPPLRARLTAAAHDEVANRFLISRELADYARLYREVSA